MGWAQDVADRVRKLFVDDKDRKALDVQRGVIPKRDKVGQGWSIFSRSGYEGLAEHLRMEHDLLTRYFDYEEMDDFPELSSSLDIYADDSTKEDLTRRRSVWVVSEDDRVREILDEMLHETIRIEEDLWSLARTLSKYGNGYGELLVNKAGVIGVNFLPPPTMRRMEDYDGGLLGFIQDPDGKGVPVEDFKKLIDDRGRLKNTRVPMSAMQSGLPIHKYAPDPTPTAMGTSNQTRIVPFEDWEVVHWRLRSKHMRTVYGHSILEPARWVWRRLVLLEDAAVLYKLTRAPARYAFYIDTGQLAPAQAMAYVSNIKQNYKKKKYVDTEGKLDFRVNPLAQDEDFWLPTRGGKDSTRIDVLSGPDWQSMEDIEYFRDKLFGAIKVPRAYVGLGGDGDTRASLSQQDVRFASSVLRLQRELRNGLKKICRVHLSAIGIDPHSVKWDLAMTTPSTIFELAQIEARNAEADLANNLSEYASKKWILANVFGFSEDEIKEMQKEQENEQEDKVVKNAELQKKSNDILGVEPQPMDVAADEAPPEEEQEESSTDLDFLDALRPMDDDGLELRMKRLEARAKKFAQTSGMADLLEDEDSPQAKKFKKKVLRKMGR